jgi:hypothetical protein
VISQEEELCKGKEMTLVIGAKNNARFCKSKEKKNGFYLTIDCLVFLAQNFNHGVSLVPAWFTK